MRARSVYVGATTADVLRDAVLASDARSADGTVVLRKGARIGANGAALAKLDGREIHVVELEGTELGQDETADRLARAAAGPGTTTRAATQGQARIVATVRGVLRVRVDAVRAINERPPLLLFTHLDGQPVSEGDELAGAKSAALGTPERLVAEVDAELRRGGPAIQVAAFRPREALLVVTERLEPRGRGLVIDAVRRKLAWYGSTLSRVVEAAHERDAARAALSGASEGLILVSGANPLDPLDPAIVALRELGGELLRAGVPGHPGSMAWTGRLGGLPVLGVATCAGFGKNTALDLVLARVLADEPPERASDAIGHGGLLEGPSATARYPRYDGPRS